MNALALSTSIEALAEKLIDAIGRFDGDFFAPIHVVAPNRYLSRWIQMRLARRLGVAMNVQFDHSLERLLWKLLREVDPDRSPVEQISEVDDRLLVASLLLESRPSDDLESLSQFCQEPGGERDRTYWRRTWHLAGKMADLLRDYEYHRQENLDSWKHGEFSFSASHSLERSQRALYLRLCGDDGLRAKVGQIRRRRCFNLPNYAEHLRQLKSLRQPAKQGPVHLFGIGAMSAWHARTFHWLSEWFDLHIYHANPLVGRITTHQVDGREELDYWIGQLRSQDPNPTLTQVWGHAGVERIATLAEFTSGGANVVEVPARREKNVLQALQEDLIGRSLDQPFQQDRSLQIVACPGVVREIETVHNSILHNLKTDPSLRLTDIAVLCPDMAVYRPVIQSVFDRPPCHVPYNMADYSAAELSLYGRGVLDLLDLAMESFTRSRVMAVLLNPCCLEGLNISREDATCWLDWAEKTGIFHGWNRSERLERGYLASDLHTWQLGLRRLRLGRIMDAPDDPDEAAAGFADVLPFSDLATADPGRLDAFIHIVQQMLPWLSRLRNRSASGREWAAEVRSLAERFLQPPADRPEEKQVRDALFQVLEHLSLLDEVGAKPARLSLTLVREFIHENLLKLTAATGEYLINGVTISAPQPVLPTPFRIIYLVGMGEGPFPGPDAYSPLDLRGQETSRQLGDIHMGEANRFLFLQTILAARDKLYITYNCRDLQKDQDFASCGPVGKLKRYLQKKLLADKPFQEGKVPLSNCDVALLEGASTIADASVCYAEEERLLALNEGMKEGRIRLDETADDEVKRKLKARERPNDPSAPAIRPTDGPITVRISDLARFLRDPAAAYLKQHLRLRDEDDVEVMDEEPLALAFPHDYQFKTAALDWLARTFIRERRIPDEPRWRQHVEKLYYRRQREGRAPDGCFGEFDRHRQMDKLRERYSQIHDLLANFPTEDGRLAVRMGPCLGADESTLVIPVLEIGDARLEGSLPFVWIGKSTIDILVLRAGARKGSAKCLLRQPALEASLTYVAWRAQLEVECQKHLHGRDCNIHLCEESSVQTFSFKDGAISTGEANDYLRDLVSEYLDGRTMDMIPFDLVAGQADLLDLFQRATNPPGPEQQVQFHDRLQEELEIDLEKPDKKTYRMPAVVRLDNPVVPADALSKLVRRFSLLQRPLRPPPAEDKAPDAPTPKKGGKRGR